MSSLPDPELNVLIFWDQTAWVTSCLEHNIVAQGDCPFSAIVAWCRVFQSQIEWTGDPGEPWADALLIWDSWDGQTLKIHTEPVLEFTAHFWVKRV